VGQHLTQELLQRHATVMVFDCASPKKWVGDGLLGGAAFIRGDITDWHSLDKTMRGFRPTCVIHLASWGMSGPAMLDPRCRTVNVEGARASLDAAVGSAVESFIYLSTYNVVFHGQEIVNGDESMPYAPSKLHTDC
jgi:nucleoside-diphosphate-sugar epimerase